MPYLATGEIMIRIHGATPRRTQKEIMQAALGELDENGVPFEVIEITSLRNEAGSTTVHGAQDTTIEIADDNPSKSFYITHSDGRIKWEPSKFGGKPVAFLAKTEKNLNFLAHHYYDKTFIIKDSIVRSEVESRAKKIIDSMDEKQKEQNQKRIQGMVTHKDGGIITTNDGNTLDDEKYKSLEKALKEKEMALKKKEQELNEKAAFIESRIAETTSGPVKVVHTKEELEAMHISQIRSLASGYYKFSVDSTDKKAELIEMILSKKEDNPEEIKTETVVG